MGFPFFMPQLPAACAAGRTAAAAAGFYAADSRQHHISSTSRSKYLFIKCMISMWLPCCTYRLKRFSPLYIIYLKLIMLSHWSPTSFNHFISNIYICSNWSFCTVLHNVSYMVDKALILIRYIVYRIDVWSIGA